MVFIDTVIKIQDKEETESGFAKLANEPKRKAFHQGRASAFAESRRILNKQKKFWT